eukprot:TRINITY_DN49558_c0_g1_i1.p1 TRINITY_DN49558_c0_g1~~TRINITY_DN49558_c0_g1_i1.p1  ORF type:complete len:464 (+),score=72.86 TRINITY_DN49558_c0_g1_i1:74-1465(+)
MSRHAVFSLGPGIADAAKHVRVLVYGDSLTAGYPDYVPYAASLVDICARAGVSLEVRGCGLCGLYAEEMARNVMNKSVHDVFRRGGIGLQKMLEDLSLDEGAFDLVIIMAGTNDLAGDAEPEDILKAIQRLHECCHQRSTPTAVLNIPESGITSNDGSTLFRMMRQEVNEGLEQWAKSRLEKSREGVADIRLFVDSGKLLPWNEAMRSAGYWESDNLHFSAAGSKFLGRALAAHVLPLFGADVPMGLDDVDDFSADSDGFAAQTRSWIVLGDSDAAGDGADLMGPGGWAYQLADAVEDLGIEIENRAKSDTNVNDWMDILSKPDPELCDMLRNADLVLISISSSLTELAKEKSSEKGRVLLETYRTCVQKLKSLMSAQSILVVAGPSCGVETNADAADIDFLKDQVLADIRSWQECDHVIDFLLPAPNIQYTLQGSGDPSDLEHQRKFQCINIDDLVNCIKGS